MKTVKLLLCLFVGLISSTRSQTIEVLNKNDVYKPPLNEMVVMDKYTFGKYHYIAEKCDTLKKEIKQLDSIIIEREITQEILNKEYRLALDAKNKETVIYKEGYKDVGVQLNSSIEKNNQLLIDYKTLDDKRKKTKRWRNVFLSSSLISTGILILLVAI